MCETMQIAVNSVINWSLFLLCIDIGSVPLLGGSTIQ